METYINLLFTRLAVAEAADFEPLREQAIKCEPERILDVRFNFRVANELLKERTPKGLEDSLATARRIATVFAKESGNPRQGKRFLNTLMLRRAMAESRGIALKERILAKLMLLERFRPESFRSLADAQARQDGKPRELELAEQQLKSAGGGRQAAVEDAEDVGDRKAVTRSPRNGKGEAASRMKQEQPAEEALPLWLTDKWVKDWIASDPPLADENLQQYFYFSRDKVGSMAVTTQRLSSRAQEVLGKLVGQSNANRRNGLNDLKSLSGADAAGVLEALCERVRNEDDEGDTAILTLLQFPQLRPELFVQVITFLQNVPAGQVSINVPLKLVPLAGKSPENRKAVEEILIRWESLEEGGLRAAATAARKRLS